MGQQGGKTHNGIERGAYFVTHIGKEDTFQFITVPGFTQGFVQTVFGILVFLSTHTDADNTVRGFFQLPDVGGLGFEPFPTAVVAAEAVFYRSFI